MMVDRPSLPDWPRLMSDVQAGAYLGVSRSTFHKLGIPSSPTGLRRNLWDRVMLDLYADGLTGQPRTPNEQKLASAEIERKFMEKLRGRR